MLFADSVEGRGRFYFDHGSNPEGIKFATAGSDAVIIDTSGRVGVGTTSPTALLHLDGASPEVRLQPSADSGTLFGLRFRNSTDTTTRGGIQYDYSNNACLLTTFEAADEEDN